MLFLQFSKQQNLDFAEQLEPKKKWADLFITIIYYYYIYYTLFITLLFITIFI